MLGLGVTALGVVKVILDKERLRTNDNNDILEQRIARLRPLLVNVSPANTVERLSQRASMTEEAVVNTLFIMQKQEMIEEDLNFETAEWYYYISRKERDTKEQTRHMTLNQRHKQNLTRKGPL